MNSWHKINSKIYKSAKSSRSSVYKSVDRNFGGLDNWSIQINLAMKCLARASLDQNCSAPQLTYGKNCTFGTHQQRQSSTQMYWTFH